MKRQRESEQERTGKVSKPFNEPPKPVDRLRNVGPLPEGIFRLFNNCSCRFRRKGDLAKSMCVHEHIVFYKLIFALNSLGFLFSGWLDCPGAGDPICNLIPSKVPLGETFNELLDAGKRYSRRHVVRHQQAVGRKVG